MAIRLFNSVGGYSVGETPANVILANGDVTLGYVVSSTLPSNANIYLSAGNGNAYVTRLLTDNLLHANGVAWDFLQAGGSTGQLQFNNSGDLGGSANLTFDGTSNLTLNGNAILSKIVSNTSANLANVNANGTVNFTSSANVTLGPVGNIHMSGGSTGYILQTDGAGSLSWVSPSSTGIAGSNTQIQFNNQGAFGASANFTFTNTSNTLGVDNITLVGTGNLTGGNLVSANYFTGTLTTNAQPNITSVGTLASLNVTANANSGNVYTGNIALTGAVLSSWVPATSGTYDLGNSGGAWRNVWVSSNIFIGGSTGYIRATGNTIRVDAFQAANNISAGSLTVTNTSQLNGDLNVGGNLTVSGTTTYINVTTTAIKDPVLSLGGANNGANISSYDGYDRGLLLHNYYSNNYGPLNQAFVWSTVNNEFRAIYDANYDPVGGTVTPNSAAAFSGYANIHAAYFIGNISGTTLGGTLTTGAQPNITSTGNLVSVNVTGTANIGTANVTTLIASGLNYPTSDGSSGQFLRTDGSGHLSWQTVSTSSIANGSSNVSVLTSGNIQLNVAGATVANVSSGGIAIAGNLSATGNVTANWVITGNSTQGSQTAPTSSATPGQFICTFPVSGVTGVEYFVRGVDPAGKYTIAKIHAVTDGTGNVDWDVFGGISLGAGIGSAGGSFVVSIATGNIRLAVTPSSSNTTTWVTKFTTI